MTTTRPDAIMRAMSTTPAAPKTRFGLGLTSFILGAVALLLAFVANSFLTVIIAVIALLFGIFTFKKGSVIALPAAGIVISAFVIIGNAALRWA